MKEFAPQLAKVSAVERLVTTLFFAVLVHGIVILGVRFTSEPPARAGGETLEVTLVDTSRSELPDNPDYLANANQKGAGNTKEQARPQSAMSSPDPFELDGIPGAMDAENRLEELDGTKNPDTLLARSRVSQAERQVLTRSQSELKASSEPNAPAIDTQRLLVARLMTPGIADLEPVDDASQKPLAKSDNLREKLISVNTQESVYARYLEGWRRRIEDIGNRNYPADLKRRGLYGSLVMEVALNADGTLRDLDIRRHSDYPEMDAAALKILREGSPFAPFTPQMRQRTDVLRFVYEWRFAKNGASGSVRSAQ